MEQKVYIIFSASGASSGNKNAAKQCGQNVHSASTAQHLAREHGVDEKTIRRDGQFAAPG